MGTLARHLAMLLTLLGALLATGAAGAQSAVAAAPTQDAEAAAALAAATAAAVRPDLAPASAPKSGFSLTSTSQLDFHARGLNVADAMTQLRQLVQRNIIVASDVRATFTGDLYGLTVEQVIAAVCRSTGLVAKYEPAFIYIDNDKPETRIFELGHARAEDVLMLITPLLSSQGRATATQPAVSGIVSSQEEAGGDKYASADTIVVRDLSSNLDEIAKIVASVDAMPRQVMVEATILSAELLDDFAFGVEFSGLLGANFADGGVTSPDGQSLEFGGFSSGAIDDGLAAASTSMNAKFPAGGLSIGVLKDGVAAFIRALQTVTDTTILANPKITTLNKQRGEVLLGRRDGYLTTTVTQTSTTQVVEFLETGTRLVYRPFITGDDLVRLEIHPEDSDGGVTAEGLPFKDTAEVTTNVMVRNGETVVIGGLFREKSDTIERKVPLLGDLPLLGALFRSKQDTTRREEIIIMLTPHIMGPDGNVTDAAGSLPAEPPPAWGAPAPAADPARLAQRYIETADALVNEQRYASALVVLRALQPADQQRPEVLGLRRRIWAGLEPEVSRRAVDDRILAAVLAGADAAAGDGR